MRVSPCSHREVADTVPAARARTSISDLDASEDHQRPVLEDVETRMRDAVTGEHRDLLVLQPLDLRNERLEDQVDEADQ
jgi:hypothetical protein